MGELLAFQQTKTSSRRHSARRVEAEIIFFPGVRYTRMTEPVQAPKRSSRRAPRRREKPKTEKAS